MNIRSLCLFIILCFYAINGTARNSERFLQPLSERKCIERGFQSVPYWESMQWKREASKKDFYEDEDIKLVEQNFIQFCQNQAKLPTPNYLVPPDHYSIPPIIHCVWLGSPIPPQIQAVVDSWKYHNPGWELKIWTDEEVENFPWSSDRTRFVFEKAKTYAEKADVLRLEVLYQFGGIYSDVDVVCMNSFHDLILQDITFFSCFEMNYTRKHHGQAFFIGTAVMGAAKGSQIMKCCLEECKTDDEAPNDGIVQRTGPGLVSRVCQRALQNPEEHILILPCSYFYPLSWKNRGIPTENIIEFISPESLAIHLWEGSWVKKDGQTDN